MQSAGNFALQDAILPTRIKQREPRRSTASRSSAWFKSLRGQSLLQSAFCTVCKHNKRALPAGGHHQCFVVVAVSSKTVTLTTRPLQARGLPEKLFGFLAGHTAHTCLLHVAAAEMLDASASIPLSCLLAAVSVEDQGPSSLRAG